MQAKIEARDKTWTYRGPSQSHENPAYFLVTFHTGYYYQCEGLFELQCSSIVLRRWGSSDSWLLLFL
jgi:hypothetical protein